MNKKYIVRLSDEERGVCQEIIKKLKGSSQRFRRAQILLKADVDGPGWTDARIAEVFDCRVQTIENLRKRLVTHGFELALDVKKLPEPPTPCKLDGESEAKLIAMRLGKPPEGDGHWTLQLLADELVALELADSISPEAVRKTLIKWNKKREIQYWVIPPEQDAEFVACKEEVFETYAQAYDPKLPVICMDQQPVQLIKEMRKLIAATKNHAKRIDYEYEKTAQPVFSCSPNRFRGSGRRPLAGRGPR